MAKQSRLWYYDDLVSVYKKTSNKRLGERLLHILDWAAKRGALVIGDKQGERAYPQFRLMGRFGYEIFSFWSPEPNHTKAGTVHFFRSLKRHGNNIEYRKALLGKINQLLDYQFDLDNIDGSRSSGKTLDKLTGDEFSMFMDVLDEYCFEKQTIS